MLQDLQVYGDAHLFKGLTQCHDVDHLPLSVSLDFGFIPFEGTYWELSHRETNKHGPRLNE